MRTSRGLRAGTGLLLTALVCAAPGASAAPHQTIGGAPLATRGLLVAEGAPKLPATAAASWLVADLDTGEIYGTKDPHGRYLPASTLKALTATTLIPKLNPLQKVAPTFEDVNVDGSKVGLVKGVKYSVSEVLTAMLVVSGNDAANTLATANGGMAKTVNEMNAEATQLQALDTYAVNDNGLDDPRQLSSAYDLALIGRAGMKLPSFRSYVATKRSHIRGPHGTQIAISTHDKLIFNYPGALGIKNGYTVKARATFIGAAERGGHRMIVTLMKTDPRYWPEAANLLTWGFAAAQAGATPVGKLVDPLASSASGISTPEPHTSALRPAASQLTAQSDSGLPLLPIGIVSAGMAVIAGSFLRGRGSRGRRSRSKLTLPKI
jgi:D-alanyl-D-alanine carboxypeptidase (penicillin-binding protein 5/6)